MDWKTMEKTMRNRNPYLTTSDVRSEDQRCLEVLSVYIQRLLKDNSIKGRIQGRMKSLHGIRLKMARTGKPLEQILDRVGLRVIVTSVPECYGVLALLHAHFTPIPGTFDDYIAHPKGNGYQSLHICVYPMRELSDKPIEFQVRTELMHREAECGSAAHWRYKFETTFVKNGFSDPIWKQMLLNQGVHTAGRGAFADLNGRQVFEEGRNEMARSEMIIS